MRFSEHEINHFKYKEDAEAYAKEQKLNITNVIVEDNDELYEYLYTATKGSYLFDLCGSGYKVVMV